MKVNPLLKYAILTIWIASGSIVQAQDQMKLSLDTCLALAAKNYPMIQQYELLEQAKEYSVSNVQQGKLPRLNIAGQASYQSAVTSLPGGVGPVISKDQYKLYGEVIQPLTDLVTIERKRQITAIQGEMEQQELTVQLYSVQERISEIYFAILLLQKQLNQVLLTQEELQSGLNTLNAGLKYGTVLQSSVNTLKAEMLRLDQKQIELEAGKEGFTRMLSRFTGLDIVDDTHFEEPVINNLSSDIGRPELSLFNTQIRSFQLQSELVNADNLPSFNLFFQGGVGRPALNFLSNDFELYYIGGLRLSWSVSNLYTSKKQKDILMLNQGLVENKRETFLFNTQLSLDHRLIQIQKAEKLIEKDLDIIALRESIRQTAHDQLENGVITASDYKDAVIDEDLARQNLSFHRVELLQSKNQYQLTTGNKN